MFYSANEEEEEESKDNALAPLLIGLISLFRFVCTCVRVCAEIFNDPEVSLNLFSFFLSLSLSAESVMYISIFN